jgi:hypothetical protein
VADDLDACGEAFGITLVSRGSSVLAVASTRKEQRAPRLPEQATDAAAFEALEYPRDMPEGAIEVVTATYAAWNAGEWGLERFHPDAECELIGKRGSTKQTRSTVATRSSATGGGSGELGNRGLGGTSKSSSASTMNRCSPAGTCTSLADRAGSKRACRYFNCGPLGTGSSCDLWAATIALRHWRRLPERFRRRAAALREEQVAPHLQGNPRY